MERPIRICSPSTVPETLVTNRRVVVVGCGRIAGGFNEHEQGKVLTHMAAYRKLGAAVVGCCDLDMRKAEAFAGRWSVPRYDTDLEALLTCTQPEVVSICTPPVGRVAILERVLATPSVRAVLLEKPLAACHDDARVIARLAERAACPVLVNYGRAFDPFYLQVRRECEGGKFGPLRQAVARYYGSARNNASHLIERILDMFGPAVCAKRLSGSEDAPMFELLLEKPVASAMFLPTSGVDYAPLELDLLFERGRIRIIDSEQRVEKFVSRPDENFEGFFNLVPFDENPTGTPSHENIIYAVQEVLHAATGQTVKDDVFQRSVMVDWVLDQVGAR